MSITESSVSYHKFMTKEATSICKSVSTTFDVGPLASVWRVTFDLVHIWVPWPMTLCLMGSWSFYDLCHNLCWVHQRFHDLCSSVCLVKVWDARCHRRWCVKWLRGTLVSDCSVKVLDVPVADESTDGTPWLWSQCWERHQGTSVLPTHRLGQDRQPRNTTSLSTENYKSETLAWLLSNLSFS